MMVCVHAAVGAAVGSLARRPIPAFLGGVISHLLCDLVPHRDYDLTVEAPLALAMLTWIGRRFGGDSPEFAGAVGAVFPDIENGLTLLGVIDNSQTLSPTHNESKPWFRHGRRIESPATQIALAAACLLLAERRREA